MTKILVKQYKISLAIAALMLLGTFYVASANVEKIAVGPYMVSYVLNQSHIAYAPLNTIASETYSGIPFETYYLLLNSTRTTERVVIGVTVFKPNIAADQNSLAGYLNLMGKEHTSITNRMIDGKRGVLMENQAGTWAVAKYPLDYSPINKTATTIVTVFSTYFWQNGTSELLNTIHVKTVVRGRDQV